MQIRDVVIALVLAPIAASAQATAGATAAARARAEFTPPAAWTASGKAHLSAMYDSTERDGLPAQPIATRVAEGEAKGASEAAILLAASRVRARLVASHRAIVAGGRTHPSGEETERGAQLMEHGMTSAQIGAVVAHAPSDRSLVVAFDVLSRLAARGVPVSQAVAQVQAKLDARASDEAMLALAGRATGSAGAAGAIGTPVRGAGGASAAAGGAGAVTGATRGIGAGVTGTVVGAVKKP